MTRSTVVYLIGLASLVALICAAFALTASTSPARGSSLAVQVIYVRVGVLPHKVPCVVAQDAASGSLSISCRWP